MPQDSASVTKQECHTPGHALYDASLMVPHQPHTHIMTPSFTVLVVVTPLSIVWTGFRQPNSTFTCYNDAAVFSCHSWLNRSRHTIVSNLACSTALRGLPLTNEFLVLHMHHCSNWLVGSVPHTLFYPIPPTAPPSAPEANVMRLANEAISYLRVPCPVCRGDVGCVKTLPL